MSVSSKKNSRYYNLAAKDTVPASVAKTGTIDIAAGSKNVVGTSTAFKSELKPGDWIVDLAQDECRKVMDIRDDEFLTIDSAFTGAVVGIALVVTRSRAKQVSVANVGGANGTSDGANIVPAQTLNYGKADKNPDGKDFIDPIIVDPTGTTIQIEILK